MNTDALAEAAIAAPASTLRDSLAQWGRQDRAAIAAAKRFWERLLASAPLRAALAEPGTALRQASARYAPLYERLIHGAPWSVAELAPWPDVAILAAWREQLARHRDALRAYPAQACADPRFQAWRAREIARAFSELGTRDAALTHPAVAYELSSGCSLGCWFCGISAERFAGHAPYETHGALWRGVLRAMTAALGPAAQTGVCFGATDPFDNPDYDLFARDHHRITGALPPTTTAAPLRDIALTRAMLARSQQDGPVIDRFSILSTRIMDGVLDTFSAEELLLVDLVPQMAGSRLPKAQAGRARLRQPASATIDPAATTIACVTGFLLNLPERRIRLVSPCRASDEWPLGYRIYADAHFADAQDLVCVLEDMIASCMGDGLPMHKTLRFRSDLRLVPGVRSVRLHNGTTTHDVAGYGFVPALAAQLAAADRPLREIVAALASADAPVFEQLHVLQRMYEAGLLETPPAAAQPAPRSPAWN